MTKRLIIILGYTLSTDGSIQPILKSRLNEALAIYRETDTLLVCGKHPPKAVAPQRCEQITEAAAMEQYLLEHGVPVDNILKEERSETTFGNALFTYLNILQGTNIYHPIIVISNEFHGPLVKYCFDKIFGDQFPYSFHAVPDKTLDVSAEELIRWKDIIHKLVTKCYPLLFSNVKNGDINAIEASIMDETKRAIFTSAVKNLLNLDTSADIIIASQTEIKKMIELLPYTPKWEKHFKQLRDALQSTSNNPFLEIAHIGSTSIPGAPAKDIVDIQCAVDSFDKIDAIKLLLEPLGFVYFDSFLQDHVPFHSENYFDPNWEKRFFSGSWNGQKFNIHIRIYNSLNWKFAIQFRDFMIANNEARFAYMQFKERLASTEIDIKSYCAIKDSVIDLLSQLFFKLV